MLGNFLKIDLLFKTCKFCLFFMRNDRLSSKQVGSQASRRVTRRLAWIQPVCISINAVPALKGLKGFTETEKYSKTENSHIYTMTASM